MKKIQESVKIYEICINMQVKKKAELSNLYLSDDKFYYIFYNNHGMIKKSGMDKIDQSIMACLYVKVVEIQMRYR